MGGLDGLRANDHCTAAIGSSRCTITSAYILISEERFLGSGYAFCVLAVHLFSLSCLLSWPEGPKLTLPPSCMIGTKILAGDYYLL